MTTPVTLDPEALSMHALASGVRATTVGEDGDVMLMGHHDDPQAWASFCEYRAYEEGDHGLTDDDCKVYDIVRTFAAFSDHSEGCSLVDCSCESDDVCDPCREGRHNGCTLSCLCQDDYDHDRPEEWPCFCECYCDEYAWWVSETKSGHEVTWVRWSWAKDKARRTPHPTPCDRLHVVEPL